MLRAGEKTQAAVGAVAAWPDRLPEEPLPEPKEEEGQHGAAYKALSHTEDNTVHLFIQQIAIEHLGNAALGARKEVNKTDKNSFFLEQTGRQAINKGIIKLMRRWQESWGYKVKTRGEEAERREGLCCGPRVP